MRAPAGAGHANLAFAGGLAIGQCSEHLVAVKARIPGNGEGAENRPVIGIQTQSSRHTVSLQY